MSQIEILDATPSVADVISGQTHEPINYRDRKEKLSGDPYFRTMHRWALQTHAWARVAELLSLPTDVSVTVLSGKVENDDNVPRELAELGAVCAVYFVATPSPETLVVGGGAHVSIAGLNEDGTRAFLIRGQEWRPTADGMYPWPCMANAL